MQPQNEKPRNYYLRNALLRFSLFLITYLIAVVSVFGAGGPLYLVFPMGLGMIVLSIIDLFDTTSYSSSPGAWMILGYSIYLGIALIGSLFKNRYVFIVLYAIFILLLITNIVSCVKVGKGLN